jgi:hypothetical protein
MGRYGCEGKRFRLHLRYCPSDRLCRLKVITRDSNRIVYKECRLLGYKNRVCTSQETHYFSATEFSRLMLCKIGGFHGGDCEESDLLGYKNQVHGQTSWLQAQRSRVRFPALPVFLNSRGCSTALITQHPSIHKFGAKIR